jgi:AhpD family alkylhydroperoxidase
MAQVIGQTGARVTLLEREAVTPDAAAMYDALLAQRGVVPNMFKVLAHAPDIAKGVAGFLKPLLSDGALSGAYKELVAVRISTLHQSEYAIRAHAASAKKKGASDEQIAGVKDFENGLYTEKEKLGFRLADRLHRGPREVDDLFYAELRKVYREDEVIELFLTAAAFEMFPRFIDGLHIPVTPLPASASPAPATAASVKTSGD